ncbi:esterase FE4-like isoform X2 [Nymphalis io]|nr:esterase FE4-like isoform X2 [Nymphalis io]
MTMIAQTKIVQEDCLIANVYTPETNGKKLPVLVHFHGGAFTIGWGDIKTDGNYIKSKQIIQVTFNHRLGAHGFLCLGTKDVPGNAGMKDQVALLRWVKNNIANFGGNPDEVTISGYNSGSSSVDLMSVSKMAQGLFKRVIAESGVSTAPFSVQINPIENAKRYADLFKFESVDNFDELEFFYKNLSYVELNSKNVLARPDSTFLMSPCVERDLGEERFLDDSPVNIIKSGNYEKLPMLYGYGEIQGQLRVPLLEYWEYWMNIRFLEFLPADLQFENETEKRRVAEEIKTFYFGDKIIGKKTTREFVEYFTDVMFAYPTLRSAKLHVESGHKQIYLYMISKNVYDNAVLPINASVADQCSETIGVLKDYWEETLKYKYDVEDLKTIKDILKETLLNFVTEGEPIIPGSKLRTWKPVGKNWSPHLYISRIFELRKSLMKKIALFWERIYDKYYAYPIAPPAPPPENSDS